MKKISDSPITTMQIIKPDIVKKYYEMKSGEDLYGTVDLINNTGSFARIITNQGSFTVKRDGFFIPYITLKNESTGVDIATSYLKLTENSEIVLDGKILSFKLINLWKNQWGWTNEKNQPILRYKPMIAGSIRGDIEISKDYFLYSYLETIAMLGVYYITQLENEIIKNNEITYPK